MPRTIIDVESSRPAYVRRRRITAAIAVVVLLLLALLVWEIAEHAGHSTTAPGNSARQGNLGPIPTLQGAKYAA